MTEHDPETPDGEAAKPEQHELGGGVMPEAHEHDRLPTSSMIPGAAAAGVWGPRESDSELEPGVEGGDAPDDEG